MQMCCFGACCCQSFQAALCPRSRFPVTRRRAARASRAADPARLVALGPCLPAGQTVVGQFVGATRDSVWLRPDGASEFGVARNAVRRASDSRGASRLRSALTYGIGAVSVLPRQWALIKSTLIVVIGCGMCGSRRVWALVAARWLVRSASTSTGAGCGRSALGAGGRAAPRPRACADGGVGIGARGGVAPLFFL